MKKTLQLPFHQKRIILGTISCAAVSSKQGIPPPFPRSMDQPGLWDIGYGGCFIGHLVFPENG